MTSLRIINVKFVYSYLGLIWAWPTLGGPFLKVTNLIISPNGIIWANVIIEPNVIIESNRIIGQMWYWANCGNWENSLNYLVQCQGCHWAIESSMAWLVKCNESKEMILSDVSTVQHHVNINLINSMDNVTPKMWSWDLMGYVRSFAMT